MLFNIIFKQYLNIFIRNFVLCIQIRFVSTEKTTRIASRASCSSNNCDDNDMLKQMRMLYCRSNRLVRLFSKCSKPVLLELCKSFCTVFYCSYFWTNYKKTTFSKIRVAYNNVYHKILDVPKRGSASTMFESNGIPNFEALIRKSIFSFNYRLQTSCNSLICTIEESWIMRNVIWKTWDDKLYIKMIMHF